MLKRIGEEWKTDANGYRREILQMDMLQMDIGVGILTHQCT